MAKNPFVIFGLDENCSQNELFDAYNAARAKYLNLRFEPGEVGADACNKLEDLETAYNEAKEILAEKYEVSYTGANLDGVERAIKDDKLDEAQHILDDCHSRTAQWHYLQAAVFYKKNWVSDALKQLEYACSIEPGNVKYAEAKKSMQDRMRADSTSQNNSFYNGENRENDRSYSNYSRNSGSPGCGVCDVCSSLLCADCCCECMGGDFISCC